MSEPNQGKCRQARGAAQPGLEVGRPAALRRNAKKGSPCISGLLDRKCRVAPFPPLDRCAGPGHQPVLGRQARSNLDHGGEAGRLPPPGTAALAQGQVSGLGKPRVVQLAFQALLPRQESPPEKESQEQPKRPCSCTDGLPGFL